MISGRICHHAPDAADIDGATLETGAGQSAGPHLVSNGGSATLTLGAEGGAHATRLSECLKGVHAIFNLLIYR